MSPGPCPPACVEAFHRGVADLGDEATFRGYGPEQGYPFLRDKIAAFEFRDRGADIAADEIFISDGAKCDNGNIQEIFAEALSIAIPDPVYPVYLDTNVMAGRTGCVSRRPIPGHTVPGQHLGKRFHSDTARRAGRPDLPVFSEQSHRRGHHHGPPPAMGWTLPGKTVR